MLLARLTKDLFFVIATLFVILTPLTCPSWEVDFPVEAGKVADEVRRKGGAPAEGVSKGVAGVYDYVFEILHR